MPSPTKTLKIPSSLSVLRSHTAQQLLSNGHSCCQSANVSSILVAALIIESLPAPSSRRPCYLVVMASPQPKRWHVGRLDRMIISLVRLPCGNGQPTAEQHAGLLRRKDPLHQDVRAFLNRRHGLDGRRDIVAVEVVPAALPLRLEYEELRCSHSGGDGLVGQLEQPGEAGPERSGLGCLRPNAGTRNWRQATGTSGCWYCRGPKDSCARAPKRVRGSAVCVCGVCGVCVCVCVGGGVCVVCVVGWGCVIRPVGISRPVRARQAPAGPSLPRQGGRRSTDT